MFAHNKCCWSIGAHHELFVRRQKVCDEPLWVGLDFFGEKKLKK